MNQSPSCGVFFTFEGIDYAGKDTQLQKVVDWLSNIKMSGANIWKDRLAVGQEPTDFPIGKKIRDILEHREPAPHPFELQRLFILDRAEDIICDIRPALDQGKIVLRSRYALSTLAYGMLSGCSPSIYIDLHKSILGQNMIWPTVTFLIDISAEESVKRLAKKMAAPQLFEKKQTLEKVRENYLHLVSYHSHYPIGRIVLIDGMRSVDEIFVDIRNKITESMGEIHV